MNQLRNAVVRCHTTPPISLFLWLVWSVLIHNGLRVHSVRVL